MAGSKPKSSSSLRQPENPIAAFFWRRRMWVETTFALSMMEPWEKLLLLFIFSALTTLLVTGLYKYLPHHLHTMQTRARFYLLGQDGGKDDGPWSGWADRDL
ncbi:hypothetical protein BD410DRAFT_772507 [Rickenella mellea]|uniref:Uncharacterized protein n=1 Tax=Rickenella mellea TaxID=50990 RepID=A0A4Y7PZG4_9AGAM|nr:hypothetical protein BD410DRAFT_772507 [Rickenella mellea]